MKVLMEGSFKLDERISHYRGNRSQPALESLLDACLEHGHAPALLVDAFYADVDHEPQSYLHRQRLAQVLYEADRLIEAKYQIDIFLERFPRDLRGLWTAGMIAAQAGDREQALDCLLKLRSQKRRNDMRVILEAAVGQRFRMPADWQAIGDALIYVSTSHRHAFALAVQIAVRESDKSLACSIFRRIKDLQAARVSIGKRQLTRLETLVRRRLLDVLREKPNDS